MTKYNVVAVGICELKSVEMNKVFGGFNTPTVVGITIVASLATVGLAIYDAVKIKNVNMRCQCPPCPYFNCIPGSCY